MGKRDRLRGIQKGLLRRTLKTGRIATSVAAAGAKRMVRTSESDDVYFGDSLLSHMDEMKGFAMKVGQILSYMDGVLPDSTAERLRALQQGSAAIDFDVLRPDVEESLGGSVESLFDTFDTEAIAAASIGQVHRATHAGRPVAVKVQYPGVADTFRTDFATLRTLSRFAGLGTQVDAPAIVDELRTRFLEECDYTREALWQTAFRQKLSVDGVHIPEVITERSTETVLTTTFSSGVDFYTFAEGASQEQRNSMAERLFKASFRGIFRYGAINGDPHPGNYLFDDDTLVLLDWGCVRAYDKAFIDVWKRMARTVLAKDFDAFAAVFPETGMVGDKHFDMRAQWDQVLYLYEPFMIPGFTYTAEYVARSKVFVDPRQNPNLRHMAMPPEWIWTQRLHWGLNSVLAHLNAQGDWTAWYREILDGPWEPIRIDSE
jgi:predicted unusual protein kinase regulating ubiquinone biosynthesis (AarF/ABC1/UbiB family)